MSNNLGADNFSKNKILSSNINIMDQRTKDKIKFENALKTAFPKKKLFHNGQKTNKIING